MIFEYVYMDIFIMRLKLISVVQIWTAFRISFESIETNMQRLATESDALYGSLMPLDQHNKWKDSRR